MDDLIKELMAASGPDYRLDHRIHCAIDGNTVVPKYTSSIDAALTLAPQDSAVGLAIFLEDNPDNGHGRYRATIMPPLSVKHASDQTIYARSLPLAICIAALKSRSD